MPCTIMIFRKTIKKIRQDVGAVGYASSLQSLAKLLLHLGGAKVLSCDCAVMSQSLEA